MKKIYIALLAVWIGGVAQAAELLVDASFDTATDYTVTGSGKLEIGQAGGGWYAAHANHWTYNTADERVDRSDDHSARGIGQILDVSSLGTTTGYELKVWLYGQDASTDGTYNADLDLHVSLWGIDVIGTESGGDDHLSLTNTQNDPADDADYDYTSLVDWDSKNLGNGVTEDHTGTPLSWQNLDLTGYDYVMLRVGAAHAWAGDTMYVEGASLAAPDASLGTLIIVK